MKKAHVQRVDEDAQLILQLSKEIEQLKAAAATTNGPENREKVDPCVTAEVCHMIQSLLWDITYQCFLQETYKKAASQVLYGRKKADTLILGINVRCYHCQVVLRIDWVLIYYRIWCEL